MTHSHTIERRVHQRRPYRTEVVFEDELGEGLFYVYSEDVSMGGIFLASVIPLRIGTMIFISFHLPGHRRPIRMTGEVVRITDPNQAGMKGMGVRFVGITELARKRLEEFLSESSHH